MTTGTGSPSPSGAPVLGAPGLQIIPLEDDRVVVRRGLRGLVVGGAGVPALVQRLGGLVDGTRTTEEILATFAAEDQDAVVSLLGALAERNLVRSGSPADHAVAGTDPQLQFFAEFTASPSGAAESLADADVLVVGSNLVAASLVRSLVGLGVGTVTVTGHDGLDSGEPAGAVPGPGNGTSTSLRVLPAGSLDDVWGEPWSAVVATSDFGEAEGLLDANRAALAAQRPFLPAWVANMIGYVGPLVHPFETACLRCYRLRADANDPKRDVNGSVRHRLDTAPPARRPVAVLPPMVDVVAAVAAMELVKLVTQVVPCDAVGRVIEVNLVSFRSTVRRVLKVPRCPDCGETMDNPAVAVTSGPALPQR